MLLTKQNDKKKSFGIKYELFNNIFHFCNNCSALITFCLYTFKVSNQFGPKPQRKKFGLIKFTVFPNTSEN